MEDNSSLAQEREDHGCYGDTKAAIRKLEAAAAQISMGAVAVSHDALKTVLAALSTEWRPISEARKDNTPIWALLRSDIYPTLMPGRDELERWNGLQVPLRHPGVAKDGFDIGWNVAAPVGHGGFPDEWIAGWMPLRSTTVPVDDAGKPVFLPSSA
jgi:hypothetical protein